MHGEVIKDFRLIQRLGKGGMGEVWLAEQQIVKTHVAIKLLVPELSVAEAHVERFFNEAIAVSRIHHAGIVKIFDVGFHRGRAYLVMEYLEGETLAARIRRLGRLPLAHVAELGRQVTGVLEATRGAGIAHRDLKPDNVFVVPDSELPGGERVKLLDFGIAKLGGAPGGLTGANNSMGTPAYMAPEQWNDAARADARADTYSFGCMLFEMCCGRPPFLESSVGEYCTRHLTATPPRTSALAEVPRVLDDLIARMLAKSPGERPSISELRAVFEQLAAGAPVEMVRRAELPATNRIIGPNDLPLPLETANERPKRGDPAPQRDDRPTTLGGAAAQVGGPAVRRSRRPLVGALAAAGLVTAGLGIYAATRDAATASDDSPPRPDEEHRAEPAVASGHAPPAVATTTAAPARTVKLREPKIGLTALDTYRDPGPGKLVELRSTAMWTTAHADLADACAQVTAPMRWCAGAEFATAQIAINDGQADVAHRALKKAIELEPAWSLPHVALASVLSAAIPTAKGIDEAAFQAAMAEATAAQRLDAASWQSIAAAARVYATAGKLDDTILELQRALALAPKSAVLISELALAHHAAGQDAEAERRGVEALALDPTIVSVHVIRAERALERGDAAAAQKAAERALSVAPKLVGAHLALGDAYALRGERANAVMVYRKAIELRSGSRLGAPDHRLAVVEAALAKNALPPPRGAARPGAPSGAAAALDRSTPSRPPTSGNGNVDRSRPSRPPHSGNGMEGF